MARRGQEFEEKQKLGITKGLRKSEAIIKRDLKLISQSYTREYPLVVDRGSGVNIWDVDGNQYLDFSSGVAVANIGHANPDVVKAIRDQAEKIIHNASTDFYNKPIVSLAEELFDITPGKFPKRVFYTNSGTESNECAFKLARWFTRKHRMISFLGSFHGRTFGSMTLTAAKAVQRDHFSPLVPGVIHAPFPHPYRTLYNPETCDNDCIAYLEDVILKKIVPEDEVAGVIVEPIQGEEGYIVPPKNFHKKLQKFCKSHGFLYIVDEVQTGFARSGKWFASEVYGVEPDIITMAKGIAGGLPMGACIAKKDIMAWPKGSHASTFAGNPVCCQAALASINYIKKNKLWNNAEKLGKYGLKFLSDLQDEVHMIGDVRGLGLMLAVELVKSRRTKAPAKHEAVKALHKAFHNGLLLLPGGESTIRVIPPLIITKEDFETGLEILRATLKEL